MKVMPMIFNTKMVQALLDGRKTVTRRPIKLHHKRGMKDPVIRAKGGESFTSIHLVTDTQWVPPNSCPFGNVGDLIYVRETFEVQPPEPSFWILYKAGGDGPVIQDDEEVDSKTLASIKKWADHLPCGWCPSIHMPRWASRLTLKITNVRVERVKDISEQQAIREGVKRVSQDRIDKLDFFDQPKRKFRWLWNKLYKNWDENPFVWVIEFDVIHKNIDKYLETIK